MNVEGLFVEYNDYVLNVVRKFISNPVAVEDVSQNVWYKVWRYRDSFKDKSNVKTWLYTIARNESFKQMDVERRKKGNLGCVDIPEKLYHDSDELQLIEDYWKAFFTLKQEYQDLILLTHDHTNKEIEDMYGCKKRTTIHAARTEIRSTLQQWGWEIE